MKNLKIVLKKFYDKYFINLDFFDYFEKSFFILFIIVLFSTEIESEPQIFLLKIVLVSITFWVMVFTNVKLPRSEFPQKGGAFYKKTLVKKSASIGANATIVCGVTIGEYAFVGSGSVVTKDIPSFSLVVGNPGRVVGLVDKYGQRVK